jgi:hypothetical protein
MPKQSPAIPKQSPAIPKQRLPEVRNKEAAQRIPVADPAMQFEWLSQGMRRALVEWNSWVQGIVRGPLTTLPLVGRHFQPFEGPRSRRGSTKRTSRFERGLYLLTPNHGSTSTEAEPIMIAPAILRARKPARVPLRWPEAGVPR